MVMTALMAMLGLLPMALSTGVGAETARPFAVVIIGGLITGTVMTLFLCRCFIPFRKETPKTEMKLILASFRPNTSTNCSTISTSMNLPGLTVSEARGFGQHDRDFTDVELPPKLRLEIVCHDDEAETIVKRHLQKLHTGQRGDGKIFVLPVL
jgi:nitrogen regulatory protein PII